MSSAAFREMLAIGLAQRANARVAVLLVDAARRIAMPSVQALLRHLTPPLLILPAQPNTTARKRVDRTAHRSGLASCAIVELGR